MKTSPLQFAQEFAKLKSDLSRLLVPDLQLLRLTEFWPKLESHLDEAAYHTYVDEYIPHFCRLITELTLFDLSVKDLACIRNILGILHESTDSKTGHVRINQKLRLTTFRLASVLCYIGDVEKVFPLCAELCGEKDISVPDATELEGLEAFDTLRVLSEKYSAACPVLGQLFEDIYERWSAELACVFNDRAWCLFVEQDQGGANTRGRLRQLQGTVEIRRAAAKETETPDTVTFDNQIRTPDDPFVGVTYDSLKAVRKFLKTTRFSDKSEKSYRAFFTVADSQQAFTGDSIGLAAGLVTYAQLLKPEILRHERFITSEVAFTGGLDRNGRLLPVNKNTLGLKVERIFFSPLKYLVLSEECLPDARAYLYNLSEKYPRRRLRLIGHETLADVIENHNIIRSEKVCMGTFITRKAAKYSRATKVQVPALLAILYILICLLYPKAWIFFDSNPADLQILGNRIEVFNQGGHLLWDYEFPYTINTEEDTWRLYDIDLDGRNEVLLLPHRVGLSEFGGRLHMFDDNGDTLFTRDCSIRQEYPGDTIPFGQSMPVEGGCVHIHSYSGHPVITTTLDAEIPARCYIRFWDHHGEQIGWYINSGHAKLILFEDMDGDRVEDAVFCAINNRLGCQSMFLLDPAISDGVSPPYCINRELDLTRVKRGNQKQIVFFVPSEVGKIFAPSEYQKQFMLKKMLNEKISVSVNEGTDEYPLNIVYELDKNLRVLEICFSDPYEKTLQSLIKNGQLPNLPEGAYQDTVRNRVTYFINGSYVTEGELRAKEAQ